METLKQPECAIGLVARFCHNWESNPNLMIMIIIIISIARYLIDKSEHTVTVLYKFSQIYEYTHKPQK